MDFSNLQAFVEVAHRESFSVAAERLYLTQPAVSKRVAALEEELDAPLFDRIGRKIALTTTGQMLLPRARQLLADFSDLKRMASESRGRIAGPLTMATSHHIGLHRLPAVLREFTREYPEVSLDIRFMDSEVACRAVQSGEVKLAVVTLPPQEQPLNLRTTAVWEDPLVFTVAPDHPLGARPDPTLLDLGAYPAVLPSPSTFTRRILESAMAEAGVTLQVSMSTNYLETLKMLVATGLGWSLLPQTMVDPGVQVLPLRDNRLHRTLGIVTHPQRALANAELAMIDACLASTGRPDADTASSGGGLTVG